MDGRAKFFRREPVTEATFEIGNFLVEIVQDEDGLNVRCIEGDLHILPKVSNVVEITVRPSWSNETKEKIVAHMIDKETRRRMRRRMLAHRIISVLEGKQSLKED